MQEIDIKTGLVMWEWHALGHVPISESNNPVPKSSYPWDYVHMSTRSTLARRATCCSRRATRGRSTTSTSTAAAIRWRLGGSHSSFKQGAGTRFYWQHDAEFQPGGLISVFDNGSDAAQGEAVPRPAARPERLQRTR